MKYPATRILDLDGTIICHCSPENWNHKFIVLPGVREALGRWWRLNDHIIIMTARPESQRADVIAKLTEANLYYHQLIMGVTSGLRWLYNDEKPDGEATACSVNVKRDTGL